MEGKKGSLQKALHDSLHMISLKESELRALNEKLEEQAKCKHFVMGVVAQYMYSIDPSEFC